MLQESHPRNVPDDILELARERERNSIVKVNFERDFTSGTAAASRTDGLPDLDAAHATLEHVADHIMQMAFT